MFKFGLFSKFCFLLRVWASNSDLNHLISCSENLFGGTATDLEILLKLSASYAGFSGWRRFRYSVSSHAAQSRATPTDRKVADQCSCVARETGSATGDTCLVSPSQRSA